MKIKATTSFAGVISMHKGQVLDCSDNAVVQDLIRCGYVKEVNQRKASDNEQQEEQLNEQPDTAENGGEDNESKPDTAE